MQTLEEGRGRGQQVWNGGGRTFRLDGLHVHLQVATAGVQAPAAPCRYTDGRPSPSLATIQVVAVLLQVRNGGGRTFRLDGLPVHRQVATAAVQAPRRYTDGRPSPSRAPSRSPSRLAPTHVAAVLPREQPGEGAAR